jgi:hypothetical protein
MMLACRQTNSATLQLAAADLRTVVTTDVGDGAAANTPGTGGVSWYFSTSRSWGFFPTGATVNRTSCDFPMAVAQSALRMCIHTSNNNISSGYRCGDNELNGSTAYERIILVHP